MKRYLIDTHALLWAADETDRLGPAATEVLAGTDAIVYVSIATLWELAVKQNVGKLSIADDFFQTVLASGYLKLPIEIPHLERYRELPLHHRDPFDRLLVAQAQAEDLVVITQDPAFENYGVSVVW